MLEQENGPISFASRSLNATERKYSATDREFLALVWALKKFKQYLLGRQFVCQTDHKPLLALVKSSPANGRHARYLLTLEEFDFTLNYIPGKKNVAADFLSRTSCANDVTAMTCANMHSADNNKKQVPEEEVNDIIRSHHQYGHLGIMKTKYSILNSGFWFPGMYSKIRRFVNECAICAQCKSYSTRCKAGALPKEDVQPFEIVSIDLVGPLKRSINNSRYILTMIDNASRWAEAVALSNISAENVITALVKNWIHRFGPPRYFLTDRGTQFTSQLFTELSKKFNFKHKCTTIFHPQGNSICERLHREIKDRIRCTSGSWYNSLQESIWHHNRTVSASTGLSPFHFLYGRSPTIPIEWPDYHREFLPHRRKCPKYACPKNFRRTALDPTFLSPIRVMSRLSDQLIKLVDGRVLHLKNCRVIW